eukprot:246900-Rhodomonas_salina.1
MIGIPTRTIAPPPLESPGTAPTRVPRAGYQCAPHVAIIVILNIIVLCCCVLIVILMVQGVLTRLVDLGMQHNGVPG